MAPVIVDRLSDLIATLKSLGYTIVLVEQNTSFVQSLADRFVVVERGAAVLNLIATELQTKSELVERY